MAGFNDFPGTVQAAILLFLLVVSGGLGFAFYDAPKRTHVMGALAVSFVVVVLFFLLGMYYSELGWPVAHVVIVLVCVWTSAVIGAPRLHQAWLFLLFFSGVGLLGWYAMLVHGAYVGRGEWVSEQKTMLQQQLDQYKSAMVHQGQRDYREYTAGWLESSEVYVYYRRRIGDGTVAASCERAYRLWHTWLTGLWARRSIKVSVWYPGGRVIDGAPKMEWRERPGS